jgi:hypothetical protein
MKSKTKATLYFAGAIILIGVLLAPSVAKTISKNDTKNKN